MTDNWQFPGLSAERVSLLTSGELVKVSFLASQKSRSPLFQRLEGGPGCLDSMTWAMPISEQEGGQGVKKRTKRRPKDYDCLKSVEAIKKKCELYVD